MTQYTTDQTGHTITEGFGRRMAELSRIERHTPFPGVPGGITGQVVPLVWRHFELLEDLDPGGTADVQLLRWVEKDSEYKSDWKEEGADAVEFTVTDYFKRFCGVGADPDASPPRIGHAGMAVKFLDRDEWIVMHMEGGIRFGKVSGWGGNTYKGAEDLLTVTLQTCDDDGENARGGTFTATIPPNKSKDTAIWNDDVLAWDVGNDGGRVVVDDVWDDRIYTVKQWVKASGGAPHEIPRGWQVLVAAKSKTLIGYNDGAGHNMGDAEYVIDNVGGLAAADADGDPDAVTEAGGDHDHGGAVAASGTHTHDFSADAAERLVVAIIERFE